MILFDLRGVWGNCFIYGHVPEDHVEFDITLTSGFFSPNGWRWYVQTTYLSYNPVVSPANSNVEFFRTST